MALTIFHHQATPFHPLNCCANIENKSYKFFFIKPFCLFCAALL